jgi:hypothetical protein
VQSCNTYQSDGIKEPRRPRTSTRGITIRGSIAGACLLALLAAAPTAGAKSFPTHPFVPGSIVIADTTYPANGNPSIVLGQPLANGANAVAGGKYPEVFNNSSMDGSFAVSTPVDLLDVDSSGNQLKQVKVPTDQVTTSFSSKSEGAINFSTNGQDLSFLGYNALPNALDASNSDTPLAPDPTNPDTSGPYNRVAAGLSSDGSWSFTDSNAFSGDNGRAALLNNDLGVFYAAGNSNNGSSTTPNAITNSGGAQGFAQSFDTQAAQYPGAPITRLGNFTYSVKDKYGKDTNFRGLTVYGGVVYLTKGSGSNGTNSVYFIDTTGTACSTPNGSGLPAPGASLPTLSGAPYRMCVLKGFNDLPARGPTAPDIFPFGIWFANPNTLYVADEGSGSNTFDPTTGTYTDAAAQTNAGLQKWVFNSTSHQWNLAYTLQNGLNLGQPYTVPAYPKGTNSLSGLPWAPATDGLRNISGHVNGDGTVTIYAATSTVSGSGDQGADPNQVLSITDSLDAISLGTEQFTTIAGPRNRVAYRGVAVVPDSYGS